MQIVILRILLKPQFTVRILNNQLNQASQKSQNNQLNQASQKSLKSQLNQASQKNQKLQQNPNSQKFQKNNQLKQQNQTNLTLILFQIIFLLIIQLRMSQLQNITNLERQKQQRLMRLHYLKQDINMLMQELLDQAQQQLRQFQAQLALANVRRIRLSQLHKNSFVKNATSGWRFLVQWSVDNKSGK